MNMRSQHVVQEAIVKSKNKIVRVKDGIVTDGYTCRCDKTPKKEEPSKPDLYDTGYYNVYGDEDSNLNGEC